MDKKDLVSIPCHRGLNLLPHAIKTYNRLSSLVSIPCHRGLNLLPVGILVAVAVASPSPSPVTGDSISY